MKKAFTLLELLVSIAILATLMGLLLPVFSAAKISSSRAISAQSLNQLMVSGRLYLNDHNNTFWPYLSSPSGGGYQWWFGFETVASHRMPEGQRIADYSKGPLGPYTVAAGGIKTDPAFLQYSPRLKPKFQDGNYGYGYNDVLAGGALLNAKPLSSMNVELPSQMVVFATCAQINNFQAATPMIEEFCEINDTQQTVHFRHGGEALAAFLDGSVRALNMAADMKPGSQDMTIPSANIGILKKTYVRQADW